MAQQQVEARKKELEQSLEQVQNLLKSIIQDMEKDLDQNFFLEDNVVRKKNVIISKNRSRNAELGKKLQPKKS